MKQPEKPSIMIGYSINLGSDYILALQISYGIEEEGCLSELVSLDAIEDIALCAEQLAVKSQLGVAAAVHDHQAVLYCAELKSGKSLLSLESKEQQAYRRLGKNAARYVKNIKLDL